MLCGCCLEELLLQGNVPRSELQMSPQYKQSMPWTDCLYTHALLLPGGIRGRGYCQLRKTQTSLNLLSGMAGSYG